MTELADPVMIAASAMRKLQALRLLSTPGVETTTDVVVTLVQDLERTLMQAPSMRLHRAAARADWDAGLAALLADTLVDAPAEPAEEDAEERYYHELHRCLRDALRAVVLASDGEIRRFV